MAKPGKKAAGEAGGNAGAPSPESLPDAESAPAGEASVSPAGVSAAEDGKAEDAPEGSNAGATSEPAPMVRVAFALEARTVYLPGGLTNVLGGAFLDHPADVAIVAKDPGFRIIEVPDRAAADELRKAWTDEVERLKKHAAELGMVVSRHGEGVPPARKR